MRSKRVRGPHEDITYKIIGAAMAVHRRLGPGRPEREYQRDMELELPRHGLNFEPQKVVEVYDQGVLIGLYILDFLVEDLVVVEIKALGWLDKSHLAQIITYLVATGCPVGLLINFGERSLKWRRVFPPPAATEHRINRQWLYVPDWLKDQQRSKGASTSKQPDQNERESV
jgi:GxxExxY protein